MSDDVIYNAVTKYASDIATLAMKSAVSGIMLGSDENKDIIPFVSAIAANVAVAAENGGLTKAEYIFSEDSVDWKTTHQALGRAIDLSRYNHISAKEDITSHVINDMAIQKHSQAILAGLEDPEKAKELNRADKNVMEALQDGGDLENLVRKRAVGQYEDLTIDQQDDIAQAIKNRAMISPDLAKEIPVAEDVLKKLINRPFDDAIDSYPPVSLQGMERAHLISEGKERPINNSEVAVLVHSRAFPDRQDEASAIAKGTILTKEAKPDQDVFETAIEIERLRSAVNQAQLNVANGTSNSIDRNIAFGRGFEASEINAMQYLPVDMLTKARLAHKTHQVSNENITRTHDIAAFQSVKASKGII